VSEPDGTFNNARNIAVERVPRTMRETGRRFILRSPHEILFDNSGALIAALQFRLRPFARSEDLGRRRDPLLF